VTVGIMPEYFPLLCGGLVGHEATLLNDIIPSKLRSQYELLWDCRSWVCEVPPLICVSHGNLARDPADGPHGSGLGGGPEQGL
jgi:hypothetical protein